MSDARRQRIAANRAAVAAIRARTHCAMCGAQPVDWHCSDHTENPSRRIHKLAGTSSRTTILAEIARCTPLCRFHHMQIDGRLDRLVAMGRARAHRRAA